MKAVVHSIPHMYFNTRVQITLKEYTLKRAHLAGGCMRIRASKNTTPVQRRHVPKGFVMEWEEIKTE